MNLTMEEISLLAVYGDADRTALIAAVRDSIADMDEPEMRELAESAAAKLDAMSNTEFSALDISPDFDDDDDDDDDGNEETEG